MRAPILVCPDNPVDINQEDLADLVERLRSEGLDARPTHVVGEGGGIDSWWEIVTIWIGLEVSKAVIEQVVSQAVEWAKERLRRPREGYEHVPGRPLSSQRRKGVRVAIVQYEGNEGQAVEVLELETGDADHVRRSPENFEKNTRFRPPESAGWQSQRDKPTEDIKQELPTLPLPDLLGSEEDLLPENRERLYARSRNYPVAAVLDAWLLIEAAAQAAAIRNNIDLSTRTPQILRTLADRDRIPELVVEATNTLQHIRSRVAPRPVPGLWTAEAYAYVDTVTRVVAYLARA